MMIYGTRICTVCGKPFTAKRANQVICSDECAHKKALERAKEAKDKAKEVKVSNVDKIREMVKNDINYGKMVADAEYHVVVDKIFEDNMDEIRQR